FLPAVRCTHRSAERIHRRAHIDLAVLRSLGHFLTRFIEVLRSLLGSLLLGALARDEREQQNSSGSLDHCLVSFDTLNPVKAKRYAFAFASNVALNFVGYTTFPGFTGGVIASVNGFFAIMVACEIMGSKKTGWPW